MEMAAEPGTKVRLAKVCLFITIFGTHVLRCYVPDRVLEIHILSVATFAQDRRRKKTEIIRD